MNLSPKELAELEDKVSKALDTLMEYCDCIQILASVQAKGGTTGVFQGRGTFYGRTGLAHEFLSRDQADNIGVAVAARQNEGED